MRRHQRRRVLAFLGAGAFAAIAIAIGLTFRSEVERAIANSPSETDSAGMYAMSMVLTGVMATGGAVGLLVVAARIRPRRRWRPPPGWPPAPPAWTPPAGWIPEPSWPRPPPDWVWWDEEP